MRVIDNYTLFFSERDMFSNWYRSASLAMRVSIPASAPASFVFRWLLSLVITLGLGVVVGARSPFVAI